ncbi:MAG: hypothetical protein ACKVW3_13705 [Phycisphaerales bacterium]
MMRSKGGFWQGVETAITGKMSVGAPKVGFSLVGLGALLLALIALLLATFG